MKYSILITSLLAMFLLISCTHQVNPNKKLVQADSLMQEYPDSALHLLQNLEADDLNSQADYAYYALLLTQARDKNYIPHTSDSLIMNAVHYYDSIQDIAMQAKARYYLGCTWRDRDNCPQAIKEYLSAISLAKKASNYKLVGIIYNSTGNLYYLQNLYEEADSIYKITQGLAIQQKDSSLWIEALTQQGKINIKRGKNYYQNAEKQLLKSLEIINLTKLDNIKAEVSAALSSLYNRIGNGKKSIEFAKLNIKHQTDTLKCYRAFLILGDAYYKMSSMDSAKIYLIKSLQTKDYFTKAGAYMRLADIAKEQGKIYESLEMERKYSAYKDSAQNMKQSVAVVNTEKTILINDIKQEQHATLKTIIYISISIFAILLCIVIYFFSKRNKYRNESNLLKEELSQQQIYKKHFNFETAKETLKNCESYKKMARILAYYRKYNDYQEHFNLEDQKQLSEEIDTQLNNYIIRLKSKYPELSEKDVIFCCLHIIELTTTDIAIITERTRNSVYKREQYILDKKMHLSTQEHDFIEELKRHL